MGDRRFKATWAALQSAGTPAKAIRALPDDEVVSALAASRNIEDEYLSNVLATEAQNRIRRHGAVLDSIQEGVVVYDADGRPVSVNAALSRMLGHPAEDLLDLSIARRLFDPVTLAEYTEAMKAGSDAQHPVTLEVEMIRKDGERIETQHTLTFIQNQLGMRTGAVVVIRDVTRARREKRELERTTRYLSLMLEHTPVLMALLDRNYDFILVNDAYASQSGLKREAFPGRNHFDLFPNEDVRRVFETAVHSRRAHVSNDFYLEHERRGPTWWDWRVEPVVGHDGEVEYLLLTTMDATPRHLPNAESVLGPSATAD